MQCNLDSTVVAITGGAGGIGREIAAQFGAYGASVAIIDVDREAGKRVETELRSAGLDVVYVYADISQPLDCDNAVNEAAGAFGGLDVLINCAGLGRGSAPYDLAVEDWDYVLNVNLRAAFLCARAAAKHMQARSGGSIVNIASTRALMSEPNTEAYAASKGGLLALTHALAASLAKDNIQVNCISPGWICVDGYEKLSESDHKQHTSGRVGRPLDIARACLYLTSEGNEFINGQNIVIDGGMTTKMIYTD